MDPEKRKQFSRIFKGEMILVGWLGQNEEARAIAAMGSRNFFLQGLGWVMKIYIGFMNM